MRAVLTMSCTMYFSYAHNTTAQRLLLKPYLLFQNVCFLLSFFILLGNLILCLCGASVPSCIHSPPCGCSCLKFIETLAAQIRIRQLIHSLRFWQEQIQQPQLELGRIRPPGARLMLYCTWNTKGVSRQLCQLNLWKIKMKQLCAGWL